MRRNVFCLMIGVVLMFFATALVFAGGDGDKDFPVVPHLFSMPDVHATTVPSNGDLNPYGVAFVPNGFPEGGLSTPETFSYQISTISTMRKALAQRS